MQKSESAQQSETSEINRIKKFEKPFIKPEIEHNLKKIIITF
jgi:hypothetical protein